MSFTSGTADFIYSGLSQLEDRVEAVENATAPTPLAAENSVLLGVSDGVTLSYAFPSSPVVRVDGVYAGGQLQPAANWSFTTTHLVFGAGNAPPSGLDIEVVAFYTP